MQTRSAITRFHVFDFSVSPRELETAGILYLRRGLSPRIGDFALPIRRCGSIIKINERGSGLLLLVTTMAAAPLIAAMAFMVSNAPYRLEFDEPMIASVAIVAISVVCLCLALRSSRINREICIDTVTRQIACTWNFLCSRRSFRYELSECRLAIIEVNLHFIGPAGLRPRWSGWSLILLLDTQLVAVAVYKSKQEIFDLVRTLPEELRSRIIDSKVVISAPMI